MKAELFDDRRCELGEGAFWHPERMQLFWFDILGSKLLSRTGDERLQWSFARNVFAAGWIDRDTLFIAGAGGMLTFDIPSGHSEIACALEPGRPDLRSNDGRADPFGGFWVGVMGRNAEEKAGGIWRYFRGEMRKLFDKITIPNAICFTPDGSFAHFADTHESTVWRVKLGQNGWPSGEPEPFLRLAAKRLNPDGAVCDADGRLWIALWGLGTVGCYGSNGQELAAITIPATQVSCPTFGGPLLETLYVTSAYENLADEVLRETPLAGSTFSCTPGARGMPEPRILL